MLKHIVLVFAIVLCPLTATARLTDPRASGPLSTRTQNPLYLTLLGMPLEGAETLNKGSRATELKITFSNLFERRVTGRTRPYLDMELWRFAISQTYGISRRFDVKVEMPFHSESGGFLDPFIQFYHGLFGLPNGGRQKVGDNGYRYSLEQDGQTLFDYPSAPFGPADLSLRFKYKVLERPWRLPLTVAVAPYLKLPTGRASRGLGSGYTDIGASAFFEWSLGRFHLVTQAGEVLLTGHDALGPIMRRAFFVFGQSGEFRIADGVSVIAQFTGSTSAFKNTDTNLLSHPAVDLNVGFAGSFPLRRSFFDSWYYQFSFAEDVTSRGPSVDFSVMLTAGVMY